MQLSKTHFPHFQRCARRYVRIPATTIKPAAFPGQFFRVPGPVSINGQNRITAGRDNLSVWAIEDGRRPKSWPLLRTLSGGRQFDARITMKS
jgi:hypothetical protein